MTLVEILIFAIGLAMDAFAVSIAIGLAIRRPKWREAFKTGAFFGGFQMSMPVLGYFAGNGFRPLISSYNHWAAFILLSVIGGHMIWTARRPGSVEEERSPLNHHVLLLLSVATSIDALAAGVSFAFLKIQVMGPILAIGTVTFLLSVLGVIAGNKLGRFWEFRVKILGGLILIAIGIKILM